MKNPCTCGLVSLCLVLAVSGPGRAAVVQHVPEHIAGWRGAWNPTWHPYLQNWPNDSANVTFAEFDKAALQAAIDQTVAAYGAWDAKVIVTQVDWIDTPIPTDLGPVVGAVDIDPETLVWFSAYAYNAGNGNWRYKGSNYASFAAAVAAGVPSGDSAVVEDAEWQAIWKPQGVDPRPSVDYWDIVIDVPESLITAYLDNPSADGLFVGARKSDGYVVVFGYDQWGGAADIRVQISQPPQTGPWIALDPPRVEQTMALDNPVAPPIPVTVRNAATGSLAWTAVEQPDRGWMNLAGASGGDGDAFQILIDVTGLSPGEYEGTVVVSDPAANNDPQMLVVRLRVFASQVPVIELAPASLTLQARASDPPPAATPVTVNNVGFGSLNWTATVVGGPLGWLWLTDAAGTDGESFLVHVDPTGLPSGVYTAGVEVADALASNSPQVLPVRLEVRDQDADIETANSYDDAWEDGPDGWVAYCRDLHKQWSGTEGFVVHLGDSITYANPYGQWARYGSGKTAEDVEICDWMHASEWPGGGNNSPNGWYLAAFDMPGGRSYTAESGIRTDQYLTGGADLPSTDEMFTAGFTNPDGKQYRDAEIAVVMLGTNDASANRAVGSMIADLEAIVDKVLANHTIVVLSTLPPKRNDLQDIESYNAAIREMAQRKKLPLIDFYAEILRRRPGNTWDGTLISGDGVHPSASGGGYTSASDPYANGGAALSEVGYLLRGWLSVQKVKEIKQKAIDRPPLPGDVDGDGDVDVWDAMGLAYGFGSQPGDPNWDARCDFNGNGIVDIFDAITLVNHFGESV